MPGGPSGIFCAPLPPKMLCGKKQGWYFLRFFAIVEEGRTPLKGGVGSAFFCHGRGWYVLICFAGGRRYAVWQKTAGALAEETATFSKDGLSVSVVLQNQWEADGSAVYQYSVTVTNISQSSCERWKTELVFGQAFTLLDGWNGEYAVQGKTLVIGGKDYNGALAPGAAAADIGFIIAGGGGFAAG